MSTEQQTQHDESQPGSKVLLVLGVTFVIPIILTLIAVYIYM